MAYDLNAEGKNGVTATTYVLAHDGFEAPSEPGPGIGQSNSGGAPVTPVWVIEVQPSATDFAETGQQIDGLWSTGGPTAVGVRGWGGGPSAPVPGGTGVYGTGATGVIGTTPVNNSGYLESGVGVAGVTGSGAGVAGWARSGPEGSLDGAFPELDPIKMSADVSVGVYGSAGTYGQPSTGMKAGVWGESQMSEAGVAGTNATSGPGVTGQSDSGPGVTGASNNGPGVTGSSNSQPGVSGSSKGGTGGSFESGSGSGVSGTSSSGVGGVFQSDTSAQLRLVPSATPLADSPLMETGRVGDLYLYSQAQEVGTSGTYHYSTSLWLCIAPSVPGGQAMWAQVQLGDLVGG
jgi:hypothetical protein